MINMFTENIDIKIIYVLRIFKVSISTGQELWRHCTGASVEIYEKLYSLFLPSKF
jgi:hypothetical protein